MQPEMTIHTLLKITGKSKSDLKYQNMFTTQSIFTNITKSTYTQQETHNLFWPDENSIEQCCAAHIVQGC